MPPNKYSLKRIIDYYTDEIKKHGIPAIRKEPDEQELTIYDEVVIAIGAKPAIPTIKGLKNYFWAKVIQDIHFRKTKM